MPIGDFIKSMHGPRKLSLSHWRYRLFHFYNNCNPTSVDDAVNRCGIRPLFYEHYCPLFWLTNAMVPGLIFAIPIVLIFRFGYWIGNVVDSLQKSPTVQTAMNLWAKLSTKWEQHSQERQTRQYTAEEAKERRLHAQRVTLAKNLVKHEDLMEINDFDILWLYMVRHQNCHSEDKDLVRPYWEKYREQILLEKEQRELRKKRSYEWMMFYINFSRVFVKGFVYAATTALAIGTLYVVWLLRSVFAWICVKIAHIMYVVATASYMGLIADILFFFVFALHVLLIVFVGWFLLKLFRKQLAGLGEILFDATESLISTFGKVTTEMKDFVVMFLGENCPHIEIVDEAEEAIHNA